MITNVKTSNDLNGFASQLIKEGISYLPDNDFNHLDNTSSFSKEDASLRNQLASKSFDVCRNDWIDIHVKVLTITLAETGLEKFLLFLLNHYSESN